MAFLTKFFCDRCEKEVEQQTHGRRPDQLWSVQVSYAGGYGDNVAHKADWCRPCMVEMGLIGTKEEKKALPATAPIPTLEDYIRAIVKEEVQRG